MIRRQRYRQHRLLQVQVHDGSYPPSIALLFRYNLSETMRFFAPLPLEVIGCVQRETI